MMYQDHHREARVKFAEHPIYGVITTYPPISVSARDNPFRKFSQNHKRRKERMKTY